EKGAARAAYFGKRVAVIERRDQPGGATVHTGTLPSKTLREAALFLSGYRQRDLYGVSVEIAPQLEVARLIERKNAVREQETERMLENLARHGIELIHGRARLGTNVHLVGPRERLLPFLDHEIVDRMTTGMRDVGVTFHQGERAGSVAGRNGALVCTLPSGGSIVTEKVLVTAGRVGNTKDL